MTRAIQVTSAKISNDFASRVLETAVQAGPCYGIGYWAEPTRVRTRRVKGEHRCYVLHITDLEADKRPDYVLTPGVIKAGIVSALNRGHVSVLDTDNLDGPTADIIVQCACFGEVLYG